MSKTVIKIENLSKVYRLGEVGTGTLSHDLNRFWKMNILGKDDPYAKVGQVNDRTQKAVKGEHISALSNINLEVKEGEVLGIIGKNGAGKSTLLKLLSRVTSPTTGSIKVKGRLASLLEVGTGFHPEMTGRENIYMNGTIMGMRKWEIDKQLDAIVDFAGVAKYLDTPTKRYSSGMTVRLGFAIAAHLEPEILVVDEVLAVGDAEFQKKAIGKMQDVSKNDGRTVLFVSHNMAAVQSLCSKSILLSNGTKVFEGLTSKTIEEYLYGENQIKSSMKWNLKSAAGNDICKIVQIDFKNMNGKQIDKASINEDFILDIEYMVLKDCIAINHSVAIYNEKGEHILSSTSQSDQVFYRKPHTPGLYKSSCFFPRSLFNDGDLFFSFYLVGESYNVITQLDKIIKINLFDDGQLRGGYFGYWGGSLRPNLNWETQKENV